MISIISVRDYWLYLSRGEWLWKVANIKDRNAAVYVGSSLDLLFSVHKLWLNELMQHFNWSIGLAFEQALRGGIRKESLQLHLWNLNSTSNSPVAPHQLSCQISANQSETKMSVNVYVSKHWKTLAKGNDVITNVISANQHFASTISMQMGCKFQRPVHVRSWKLFFLFPLRCQSALETLLTGNNNIKMIGMLLNVAHHQVHKYNSKEVRQAS